MLMKLSLLTIIFCSLTVTTQAQHKFAGFALAAFNKTRYDRTIQNNESGPSLGFQIFPNNSRLLKPVGQVDLNLFAGNKVGYIGSDGSVLDSKSGVLGIYAGARFEAFDIVWISGMAGPEIYNSNVHLGLKPALGVYFSKRKRFQAFTSFTHILEREHNFGFASVGVGLRIF